MEQKLPSLGNGEVFVVMTNRPLGSNQSMLVTWPAYPLVNEYQTFMDVSVSTKLVTGSGGLHVGTVVLLVITAELNVRGKWAPVSTSVKLACANGAPL